VIVITDVERPSEELSASRAGGSGPRARLAPPRTNSPFARKRPEWASEPDAGSQADGGSRLPRSEPPLIRSTRKPEGCSPPIRSGTIAVVDVYRDLATGLSLAELESLRHELLLPVVHAAPGRCELTACAAGAEARGLLGAVVIAGLIISEVRLAGHVSAQLYGPGDLLGGSREANGSLATTQALQAPVPTSLAILDDRFVTAVSRWPRLATAFFTQTARQIDRGREHQAICQLTRVEDRLLTLFWYLADRWGRVCVDGVTIQLPLTHETIGRLIGARRPTVTLGLRELARQRLLRREQSGRWLLASESLQRVNGSDLRDRWYPSPVGVAAS
jgi:CRP/FNR family transcriptional regulator, cyclic AMP receptor protein